MLISEKPETITSSPDKELVGIHRKEKYLNNTWTHEEQVFRNRPNTRNRFLAEHTVSFNKVVNEVVRKSFFGIFLKELNPQHDQNKQFNEDKWAIFSYHLKDLEVPERKLAESKNRFTEHFQELFLDAIKNKDVIDWDYLYEKIQTMRILCYEMNTLDKRLLRFKNLQVLALCGNWITELDGKNLPRKLVFLELYANQIKELGKLCNNPPKNLKYLGLGRNCLHDRSGYHHLFRSKTLKQLKCIDFSNNDICDLKIIVSGLSFVPSLVALSLEGNPCWVSPLYKTLILGRLTFLRILDNTEILDRDKDFEGTILFLNPSDAKPALVFNCCRIISLPPPKKQKGAQSFFHVEVSLPLLEEIVIEPEIEESAKDISKASTKKTKSKSKRAKSRKKGKKGKQPGVYDGEDEYEKEKKSKIKNTNFKTDRKTWDKIMEFPEIRIESPDGDMRAIRDSFRSRINVKVVYQLIEPPQKPKKGKKGKKKDKKKGKKKDKKGKKKKSKDKSTDKSKTSSKAEVLEKEPEETILKKITIANFYCDLHHVNWSDDFVDFYWAAHPKANPVAIPVEGSLKALNYQAKVAKKGKGAQKEKGKEKGKKKGKKDGKDGKAKEEEVKVVTEVAAETSQPKISKIGEIEPIGFPSLFTCHVGFGLKRN